MKKNSDVKFRPKFYIALGIFVFVAGLATIILGVNEATIDALDNIGSNYWLALYAVISGIATLPLILRRLSSLCSQEKTHLDYQQSCYNSEKTLITFGSPNGA